MSTSLTSFMSSIGPLGCCFPLTLHLHCQKQKSPEVQPIKWVQVFPRPLFSPAGFYEGIFHWLTGTAEQGNPSLHGLVGMTDANMLLLSPDTDTIIALTQLATGGEREGGTERDDLHLFLWLHMFLSSSRTIKSFDALGALEKGRGDIFQVIRDIRTEWLDIFLDAQERRRAASDHLQYFFFFCVQPHMIFPCCVFLDDTYCSC